MAGKLSKLSWYWHRLQAMGAGEVALRLRKKAYQIADTNFRAPSLRLESSGRFPLLPEAAGAPVVLKTALQRDLALILNGHWRFFGHLPLVVDDPPKWQFDYLVRKDFHSSRSAFKLDHRAQPGGADIKIIWEPSRWYQLVRFAMAAYYLGDRKAEEKCVQWLFDWARTNPPFTGLNWTSGLETGIRLVQFTWIDALLEKAGVSGKVLHELREAILPAHAWYTSRHRSFGSSANNHLIGELAGLILSVARWPELEKITSSLRSLAQDLEREILLQFAPDGANQEQALGYHLFSWEFCWQAVAALRRAGLNISEEAERRLISAGTFYRSIKPCGDPWDFGDSDNAYVTPLFEKEESSGEEWWRWFAGEENVLSFFWGTFPGNSAAEFQKQTDSERGWTFFADSGYALFRKDGWFLRWDLSSLGYLSMAPHGHLDALHVSLWHEGVPVIIDPGTGAYYADQKARNFLADWDAHNGPRPLKGPDFPPRYGTFLWGAHHERPTFRKLSEWEATAEIRLLGGRMQRTIRFDPDAQVFQITDESSEPGTIQTRWKFAPGIVLREQGTRTLEVQLGETSLHLEWDAGERTDLYAPPPEIMNLHAPSWSDLLERVGPGNGNLDAVVSPSFRRVQLAATVKLEAEQRLSFRIQRK